MVKIKPMNNNDNTEKYPKNIKITEETHLKLKIVVAELGLTFDEAIKYLIDYYKGDLDGS